MSDFVILIPPSEGKTPGGNLAPFKKVDGPQKHMIDQLAAVGSKHWKDLLGVDGKNLEEAIKSNQTILSSKTMPAIERYSGVVYDAIDYPSLNTTQKDYFNKHVRIVSAVFGLVSPTQPIANYKLKINKLGADRYWKSINRKVLKDKYVIDLLPQAHRKAVDYKEGERVDFFVVKNDRRVPAGHQGKYIKGRFIRWLAENKITDFSKISEFDEDDFQWEDGFFVKYV